MPIQSIHRTSRLVGAIAALRDCWLSGLVVVLALAVALPVSAQTKGAKPPVSGVVKAPASKPDKPLPEAAPEGQLLASIPSEFESWRDAMGFLWRLGGDGSLKPGESRYFNNTMALQVGGLAFKPESGTRREGGVLGENGVRIRLNGKAGDLAVSRDIWFDAERSGLRYVDVVQNSGAKAVSVDVLYTVNFNYQWENLHTLDGRIFTPTTADSGPGFVVQFDQASDGHPDTVVIGNSEKGAESVGSVNLTGGNQRELPLLYRLQIPAGGKRALLHWVLLRNLQNPAAAAEAVKPFYHRKKAVRAGVDDEVLPLLANFAPGSVAAGLETSPVTGELRALDLQLETLGMERGDHDLLVLGDDNLLTGTVSAPAPMEITTRFGPRRLALEEVAAIHGGGGIGRLPEVYLRDGQVLRGTMAGASLTLKLGNDLKVESLGIDQVGWLLSHLEADDGKAPKGLTHFVETSRGEVYAVSAVPENEGLITYLSPWGEGRTPLGTVARLTYGGSVGAKYRLWTKDGARLTVLPGANPLKLMVAGRPEPIELEWRDLRSLWSSGETYGMEPESEWLGFDDLGPGESPVGAAFLLRGNILLPGKFVTGEIHLITGNAVTAVKLEDVITMKAAEETDATGSRNFHLELVGGDQLQGNIREYMVEIGTLGEQWKIPLPLLLGYQRPE